MSSWSVTPRHLGYVAVFGRVQAECYIDWTCWLVGVNFPKDRRSFAFPWGYLHIGPVIFGFWTLPERPK